MAKFWQFIVDEANKGNIKLEIEMNGITYDKNFYYNPITNILVADSTDNPR